MKPRKFILVLVALAIGGAALVYTLSPRGAKPPGTAGGETPGGTGRTDGSGKSAGPGAGITRAEPSADVVPGGRDEGLVSAPPREAGALVDVQRAVPQRSRGETAVARVAVSGRTTAALAPNPFGEFPRVYVKPSESVSVRVAFPHAEVGARVVAEVEDGGKFADGKPVAVLTLDANRERL